MLFSQLLHSSLSICMSLWASWRKKRMWGWFFVTALYMTGWVHHIHDTQGESIQSLQQVMKELLWQVFIEPLCKRTVLSVEKLHTFSYTVLAEKPDRSHSCEVRSPLSFTIETHEWFCLPFPSIISDLSLLCRQKSCTFATITLWLIEHHVKIQTVSWHLSNMVQQGKGSCKLIPYCNTEISSIK